MEALPESHGKCAQAPRYRVNLKIETGVDNLKKKNLNSACAGDSFTILWTRSGSVLSCGDNSKYSLGLEDSKTYHSPKIIDKLENVKIHQIEAGLSHVVALSEDGSVYTWGTSNDGALGLGTFQTQQLKTKYFYNSFELKTIF